jgi:hypothetical protein
MANYRHKNGHKNDVKMSKKKAKIHNKSAKKEQIIDKIPKHPKKTPNLARK